MTCEFCAKFRVTGVVFGEKLCWMNRPISVPPRERHVGMIWGVKLQPRSTPDDVVLATELMNGKVTAIPNGLPRPRGMLARGITV